MTVRYISVPSDANVSEVRDWMLKFHREFDDPFDAAVGCAHDLSVFDQGEFSVDPRQDRAIPQWIVEVAGEFFPDTVRIENFKV